MTLMNYFLANLVRDKHLWAIIALSAWAGLMVMDLLTYMLTPRAVFGMWTFKIALAAAVVGATAYGVVLGRREKRSRRLNALLPSFIEERRQLYSSRSAADPEFQTFCHQCRHFDLRQLRCLLDLQGRTSHILLSDESPMRHCLYWNLGDDHEVLRLTGRLKRSPDPNRLTGPTGPTSWP